MNLKERIKNSIHAYILGDCLGVPYEFLQGGTFMPEFFKGYGVYNKPAGTWSDDTTVLLCLLDAFSQDNSIEVYKNNLKRWYFSGEFTIDGLFDIGNQTSRAIRSNFTLETTDRMGNGAMFYSLPLAILSLFKVVDFREWCSITHNNKNCFEYGFRFMKFLSYFLREQDYKIKNPKIIENKGDVVNTYNLVIKEFNEANLRKTDITEDLLKVISYGSDTDTNAAFLGAILGTHKPVKKEDWERVRENEYVDIIIDRFLEQF